MARDDRGALAQEGRIDPALEAAARVARQAERLPRERDALGGEIGDLDQDVGRFLAASRMLAAHDPGNVVDPALVGDHGHRVGEAIFLAVEGDRTLAVLRAPGDECAVELGAVVDVARAAEVEHHIIADVDERRDRALADRFEAAAHPLRRRDAVVDARDGAAVEGGAGFGVVGPDFGRGRALAFDRGNGERLQRAQSGGGEIARDPAHAHAILPVGGD